mgnify:CR=1 FL=1
MHERHECGEIRGKAQSIEKYYQFIGDQGPLVWHLEVPMVNDRGTFIINFCPFCGQKLPVDEPVED